MNSIKESPISPYVMCKRPMHQSTLTLGDQTKAIYSTTHAESFSGRERDGQELVFLPRDLPCPSQHNRSDHLSNMRVIQAQTHTRDLHGPKDIVPHHVLHRVGVQNRAQNRGGSVMKEVTNPTEATLYQTTYQTVHCSTSSRYRTNESSGQPVSWHRHNIITGEEKAAAGPGRPRRPSGESVLWAARRWETHCDSFRLY